MPRGNMNMRFVILIGILVFSVAIALAFGAYKLSIPQVISALMQGPGNVAGADTDLIAGTVVWQLRLPRVLAALAVGMALAVSGGVFQSCFRNPLVEPYILGASSGAAFGAALGIVFPQFPLSIQLSAFIFAALAVFGSYLVSNVRGQSSTVSLVLAGVIVGSIFASFVSVLKYISADAALREIVFWLMGGFYFITWNDLALIVPVVLAGSLAVWLMSWKLNVLTMGDIEARSLGVDAKKYKAVFILIATLITAVSVSAVGIIAWVGLMMPHAARQLVGPDNRFALPAAALLGAAYLVGCDTLARNLIDSEIPIGIITSLMGAPFLLFLLRSKAQKGFQ
jgi:iron complex transport system permease protein